MVNEEGKGKGDIKIKRSDGENTVDKEDSVTVLILIPDIEVDKE